MQYTERKAAKYGIRTDREYTYSELPKEVRSSLSGIIRRYTGSGYVLHVLDKEAHDHYMQQHGSITVNSPGGNITLNEPLT